MSSLLDCRQGSPLRRVPSFPGIISATQPQPQQPLSAPQGISHLIRFGEQKGKASFQGKMQGRGYGKGKPGQSGYFRISVSLHPMQGNWKFTKK